MEHDPEKHGLGLDPRDHAQTIGLRHRYVGNAITRRGDLRPHHPAPYFDQSKICDAPREPGSRLRRPWKWVAA
jgi:hypothetical protein